MNEREARGWELVRQAIERGKPLDAELNALFASRDLPDFLSVVQGAMVCLVKIVAAAQVSGAIARLQFLNPQVMDVIQRTEARLMNDLDAAMLKMARADLAPMNELVDALASAASALAVSIRFVTAASFAAPSAMTAAAFTDGSTSAQFRGYAIQTVERDAEDEIVKTRTEYFGPGAPL